MLEGFGVCSRGTNPLQNYIQNKIEGNMYSILIMIQTLCPYIQNYMSRREDVFKVAGVFQDSIPSGND